MKSYKGIMFYKLMAAFFILSFVSAVIIIGFNVRNINQGLEKEKDSYYSIAGKINQSTQNIIESFDTTAVNLMQYLNDVTGFQKVYEDKKWVYGISPAIDTYNAFSLWFDVTQLGKGNTAFLYFQNSAHTMGLKKEYYDAYSNGEITTRLGLSEKDWSALLQAGETTSVLLQKTEKMTFSRLMLAKEVSPGLILILGITEDNLRDTLRSSYLPDHGRVILCAENGTSVSSGKGETGIEKYFNYNKIKSLQKEDEITYKGKHYFLYPGALGNGSVRQVLIVEDSSFYKIKNTIFTFIAVVIFIWLLVGSLLSYLLASTLYKPIERLIHNLPIDETNKRDFHEMRLVSSIVDNLYHKASDYELQLTLQNALLADSLFQRLLTGDLVLSDEIITALGRAGFPVSCKRFVIMLFELGDEEGEDDKALPIKNYHRSFGNRLNRIGYQSYLLENIDHIIVISDIGDDLDQEIYEKMTEIKGEVEEETSVLLSIAVSGIHDSLENIKAAYQQVKQTADYNLLTENNGSVSVFHYNAGVLEDIAKSEKLEEVTKLFGYISEGQYEEAVRYIEHFCKSIPDKPLCISSRGSEVMYLVDTVYLSIKNLPDISSGYISRIFAEKSRLKDMNIKEILKHLITMIKNLPQQSIQEHGKNERIQDILNYIHSNYTDINLSASAVADYFNISLPWLSVLFKREYEEGFLEYLHRYRINKAKDMISNSDLNIKDISEMVGYNSTLTMCRAFKRYIGVTPKWFRQNNN